MPFQICRICYIRGNDLLQLHDKSNSYEQKLSSCIPEIDIYIINDPGICQKCADMLDTAFELRNVCLANEKRYNSTFNERERESTNPNQVVINCNEDSTESVAFATDETSNGQNLLNVNGIKPEVTIFCSLCNEEFSSNHDKNLHDFKKHRRLQHRNLKTLLSPIRGNSYDLLLTPQKIINETVESIFNNRNSSVSSANDNEGAVMIPCSECDMTFADNHELEAHKSMHLRKTCHFCLKTYDRENKLAEHLKLHLVRCCGESFATASLLQLHTYKAHNMTCGVCNLKFTQFGILFNHLTDHAKDDWHEVCGDQLSTNKTLNVHNYNTCSSEKADDDHLRIKEIQVEPSEPTAIKQVKYKCKKCNMGYQTRSLLTKHKYSAHTFGKYPAKYPALAVVKENLHTCHLCGRQYELYLHLQMHILQFHCDKIPTVPIVDCRKDSFYREQEGLRINFDIPPKYVINTNETNAVRKKLIARSRCICFICRILFKKISTFYLHGQNKHPSCCNENITSVAMFLRHNLGHYNAAEKDGIHKDILCMACKANHKNYVSLLAHNCKTKLTKYEMRAKKKEMWSVKIKNKKENRCTIEVHESDSSEVSQSSPRLQESDNTSTNKSGCEICKKQFDCKSRLMDHIKTHI